ncbi:DUF305 domain-containing protein [Streptomyces sp. NPDC052015]|uniref:DUF305 domain-containing protein n=1 Tax=Streptomyces sp. NPDC052015 TaxID=3154755 RepID=UPI00341547BD
MSTDICWARWLAAVCAVAVLALGAALVMLSIALSRASAVPGTGSADAGFAWDMAAHHQQAVELSLIVRERTTDEDVRRLAYDVINTQANQRGMLLGRLAAWGLPKSSQDPPMAWMDHHHMQHRPHEGALMPGMATSSQIEALRNAKGTAAEVLYLQLLTAHHQAGVTMARSGSMLAKDPLVKDLAASMRTGQQAEVELMARLLEQRGS